ncbi:T9SS type A sorting domain-containing protein [bacterium]|nr:T9SS type A sorting domain-containing protein [bacterium]
MKIKSIFTTIILILTIINITAAWEVRLKVDGGRPHDLAFGVKDDATYDFDRKIDKISPPPPPEGFYAFFYITNPDKPFLERLWEDYRAIEDNINWELYLKRHEIPVTIEWDPEQVLGKMLYINNQTKMEDLKDGKYICQLGDSIVTFSYFKTTAIFKEDIVPTKFCLNPNNPNPFNETTSISFSVAEKSDVSLSVYDVLGKEVKALYNGELTKGVYSIKWFARDDNDEPLPSGIYFCRLQAGGREFLQKMMLLM